MTERTQIVDAEKKRAQRALVVGASSGIGAALVRQLAAEGCVVAAVARRAHELESLRAECTQAGGRVFVYVHDVRDAAAAPVVLANLVKSMGGLDLFVYCAGVHHQVGPDEYDSAQDLEVVAVNFAGAVAWTNAVVEQFVKQRSGTIVGISSVAGDRGRRSAPVYGATKAALNTYLDSLRLRLGDLGIRVTTIRPGHVTTRMTVGMRTVRPIDPKRAAREILDAASRGKSVRYVPRWWSLVGMALRLAPDWIVTRIRH